MKKLLSVLLALVMLVSVISVPAFAEGETLSVVYHYTDAETGTQTTKEVTDGLTVGGTFAVDFRAPNTSEKYFIGWYTDEACTGTPVASLKTTIDGANHLYAGYKNYQSTITPYYANHDPWDVIGSSKMYFPMFAKNNVYYAQFWIGNISYAKFVPATEEDGTPYWLRSGAYGTGSQALALFDEEAYAYQFRAGSTYKFTMKIKSIAGDGCDLQVGFGKTPADINNANTGWNGDKHQLAKGTTIANSNKVKTCTDWTEVSAYVTTVGIAADAYEFFAIRTSYVASGDQIGVKDFVIEEVSAEYYVGETLINKTFPANGTAASLDAPAAEYIPEGKNFGGWYLDKELTQPATSVTVNGTVKLYAKLVDPPKAQYIAGDQIVKEEALTMGGTYTPESFMLDAQYIPAGYYFTGWYTDADCTTPVAKAALTDPVTITGDFVRYAGLKKYETSFYPALSAIYNQELVPYPLNVTISENLVYVPYIYSSRYHNFKLQDDGSYMSGGGGAAMTFFTDEGKTLYQADPTATYRISFKYKYENKNAANKTFVIGLGYKETNFDADGKIASQAPASTSIWRTYKSFTLTAGANTLDKTWEEIEETSFELTLNGQDMSVYEPLFGMGHGYMSGTADVTYYIKDLKIEKLVANANLHIGDEVNTVEVAPGKFLPDFVPEAPEGKYFTGWYTDADCTVPMPAGGISLAAGETKDLYAGFETFKTVNYYVGEELVNTVGGLKVGDTHTVAFDVAAPEGKEFKGWFTEDTFVNKAETLTIAGDVNLYAKFGFPFSVVYHYLDAEENWVEKVIDLRNPVDDPTSDDESVTKQFSVGSTYAPEYMDFIPANTENKYFVGWYLDEACEGAAINAGFTLAVNDANHVYAKYHDFKETYNVHIPGDGDDSIMINFPAYHIVKDTTYRSYRGISRASQQWIDKVEYTAETNTTYFQANHNKATTTFFLVDDTNTYIPLQAGKQYQITFKAKPAGEHTARVAFGLGTAEENMNSAGPGWINGKNALGKYDATRVITAAEDGGMSTYSMTYTVPETLPTGIYNFFAFRITEINAANGGFYFSDIVIEEVAAKVNVHVGDDVTTYTVAPGKFVPETVPTAPEGMYFSGWYTDADCTVAMPEDGISVAAGETKDLYAGFETYKTVTYYANGEVVKEIGNFKNGDPYKTESFMLDAQYIPEGYYFTGWYSDAECTQLVAEADLIKDITINSDFTRYAGLRKYEEAFNPVLAARKMSVPFVFDGGEAAEDYYAPYLYTYSYNRFSVEEDYYKNPTGGSGITFFFDENGVAYQAEAGAVYKITFDYKYTNTNDGSRSIVVGVGYKGFSVENIKNNASRGFANLNSAHDDSYWSAFKKISLAANTATETEEWATATLTLSLGQDLTNVVPIFAIGNGYMTNVTYKIKNLKVEKAVTEVNLHVGETVTTVQVTPDSKFVPETVPTAPEGKYFSGWYTDADCKDAMPEDGISVAAGETKDLYAGFETYKTVTYYANGEVVKEIGNFKNGDTYTTESFMLDAQYIPEGYYFTGWYSDAECTQLVAKADLIKAITINGDFARYAGLKPYEESFTVALSNPWNKEMVAPFLYHVGGETPSDVYVQYVKQNVYTKFALVEDETGNYYENDTGGCGVTFFTDDNYVAYQADAGASYKVTFDYKYTSTNSADKEFSVGLGYKGFKEDGAVINNDACMNDNYWLQIGDVLIQKNTETDWEKAEFVFTLDGKDLTNAALVFGIGNYYMSGVTYMVKNITVEKAVAEVNVHVGETVTTVQVTPGSKFVPENVPTAPEGKYFSGWYTDADCTVAMQEDGIDVAAGETKSLYAGFETFKTATYYANGEVVNTVGGLKIGDTYTPESFMLDSQYVPEGKYFTGWYTDEACTIPVKIADLTKEITVTGDFVRYAGLKEYEKEFSPAGRPETVESIYYSVYALQYPMVHEIKDEEGTVTDTVFTNYMVSNGVNWAPTVTEEEGKTVFSYDTAALGVFVFHDENGKVFKAKPGASYKITYEYKFEYEESTSVYVYPNIGYPVSNITASTGNISVEGYRLSGSVNSAGPNGSKGATMDTSKTDWTPYEAILATPESTAYEPFFYIRNNSSASTVYIKNIVVKELGVADSGEYSEQIGGVVYEADEVEDNESYAVTFDYTGAAANFGFFTADKESEGVYSNISKVEGGKTVLQVNGDGTYTAFVTADKLSGQGNTLYIYAKDVQTAGEIADVDVTKLDNLITNEGASILAGKTSAQAIRYYFGYTTTTGKDIIIGGTAYEVVNRGFLFANGADKVDDGVYIGATATVNKAVSGDALGKCWSATANGDGSFNIKYSTYVDGFANDDTRMLFVKGYITFKDAAGNTFTVYAGASNGSVATISALQ